MLPSWPRRDCRVRETHHNTRSVVRFTHPTSLMLAAGLLFSAGCGRSVDPELSQKFQQARQTFDEAAAPEEFLTAAALYEEILDRGVVSGAVLYNQGNAFMQAGQRGRAIAAYRRAKRYRPRDPYLDHNLRYALGTDDPAAAVDVNGRPLVEYLLFWQNWLSYPGKFYLAAAAAVVTFILGLLPFFLRRRLFARLAAGGAAVTLLLVFSAMYDWYRYDYIVRGVVVAQDVVARKGYAATSEPAFTEALAEGTEFQLVGRRNAWLLIRIAAGKEGWVEEETVVLY